MLERVACAAAAGMFLGFGVADLQHGRLRAVWIDIIAVDAFVFAWIFLL